MAGYNHFPSITEKLDKAISQVIRKTAFDGQGNIQRRIQANGQVDTGFMLNSVYVKTNESSTYGQSGVGPPKGASLNAEIAAPPDDKTAYIVGGASYTPFPNYGTVHQAAKPFWEPGIEDTRPGFEAAMSKLEEYLR